MKEKIGCFELTVLAAVTLVGGTLVRGFAMMKLWAWFVAGTFSIPSIHIIDALGIGLVFTMFMPHRAGSSKGEGKTRSEQWAECIGWSVLFPLAGLALGWIYLQFR